MPRWLWSLLCAVLVVGCGSEDDSPVEATEALRVAAFDFAESELLAELYAQALEARDIPVERQGMVGPREIVAPALQLDRIDLVPEYVGTAAAHYGGDGDDLDALRLALEPLGLVALQPAQAEDVNVFVVTKATAIRHGLERLSDLPDFAATARLGGPVECPERPLCLLGLRDTYGVTFAEFVPQRSLTRTADALARGEIDVGVLFSTSSTLTGGALAVLEDDRGLQPAENVVPVVRRSALERWGPAVRTALDSLAALTTADLRDLNRRVEDGEPVDAVAASWLAGTSLGGT